MAKHTSGDVQNSNQNNVFSKYGAAAKALVHYDLALDGPGIIEDPSFRVMTGAMSTAQAAEQVAAVAAAGGLVAGRITSETGKSLR